MVQERPRDDEAEGLTAVSYNRSLAGSSAWPEPSGAGSPDPLDPQRPPGVPQAGKNFAYRPELVAPGFRGADDYTRIGPGSEQFRRGADAVEAKQSFTLSHVNGPRRRRK
jgi:hypothetical protein